ncbi:MAG: HDIG domain-containing protein [Bacillaceae bacterium]|nr:HDIG domain-containing protein [Bacillaceae bacterium]
MFKNGLTRINELLNRKDGFIWMILSVIVIGALFYLTAISNVYPETYDLEKYTKAKETIRSPITIEDKDETAESIRKAVQAVEEQYTISESITAERVGYVHEIFDAAETVLSNQKNPLINPETMVTEEEKFDQYLKVLSDEITKNVSLESLQAIFHANQSDRNSAKDFLVQGIEKAMKQGVRSENLIEIENEFKLKVQYEDFPPSFRQSVMEIGTFAIAENAFFDPEKTQEVRKEAAGKVEPVMIHAGEIIVHEGEFITNEIYEDLSLVGVLNKEQNIFPYLGLGFFTLLLMGVMFIEWYRQKRWGRNSIITVLLISMGMITILKIFSFFDTQDRLLYYAVPAAFGVMLIKYLENERFALVLSGIFSLMGAVLFNYHMAGYMNVQAGIYFLVSQWAGIYLFKHVSDKIKVLKVGLGVFIINALIIYSFIFLSLETFTLMEILTVTIYALVSAFLSTVLTLGIIPFFEAGLGILSEGRLWDLSNPNHPLLRKILTEAPGTYHHSVMVANLSEAACEAIGANGLLARVASYYHDVGKTRRPQYFIENQMGAENPHDYMKPEESADIIIRHPYDGANMLRRHKIPQEIIDIAEQHHGTTLINIFITKRRNKMIRWKKKIFAIQGQSPGQKKQP